MKTVLQNHGSRWLFLIFLFIILVALVVSIRLLVRDVSNLQIQIDTINTRQDTQKQEIQKIQKFLFDMQDTLEEHESLIVELERMINYNNR